MYRELVHNRFILVQQYILELVHTMISTVNLRPSRAFQFLREEPAWKSRMGEEFEPEQLSSTSQLRVEDEQKRGSLFSRKLQMETLQVQIRLFRGQSFSGLVLGKWTEAVSLPDNNYNRKIKVTLQPCGKSNTAQYKSFLECNKRRNISQILRERDSTKQQRKDQQ